MHNMVLGISALLLTHQVLLVAGMAGTKCSDSVPLTKNVNGNIYFKPGRTVIAGTNVTIRCQGMDGKPSSMGNPIDYQIQHIRIFGPSSSSRKILHICSPGKNLNKQHECLYNITETKDLGQFEYLCQFITRIPDVFSCISLKNLTITDDVCLTKPSPCHQNATCTKTNSSFQCNCNEGYTGDGKNCTELEVCLTKPSPCHQNATCTKTNSSFQCNCNEGFTGDGKNCTEVCLTKPSPCHQNATCTKTNSSFQCNCNEGFIGDGKNCTEAKPQCTVNSTCHTKDDPLKCKLSGPTMQCHCRENFLGNGTHCKGKMQCSLINSTCRIDDDPSNCRFSESTMQCHCGEDFQGNGTHCKVKSSAGNREDETSSPRTLIIIVVVSLFILLVIFAIIVSFYKKRNKRKSSREETFNIAVHEMNKGRSAKDNLGILFPDEKKIVESSPRRKLPSIRDHNSFEEEPDEAEGVISYICVLDDWEVERDKLTILDTKLGGGYFGVVKKGIYKKKENDNLTVAVKMLKDAPSAADRSDLLMELYILKEVNKNPHPNVIKLIGAFTSEEPILVITEFCSRGNLRHLLRKSRMPANNDETTEYTNIFSTLCHKKLLQMAVDISNGMQHLAANQFVHRDLAARNILIGQNFEAKVSDFGLARPITGVDQMYVKSNRNLLPVKWMAVESLTHGVFRTSSDVWAFGVVLWEIARLGDEPYPDIDAFETFTLVASGKRMERPPQCSEELYDLMTKCWEHDQQKRPSFEEIHLKLKEMFAETDRRVYINVVEFCEESIAALEDNRRISVESMGNELRYTNSLQ